MPNQTKLLPDFTYHLYKVTKVNKENGAYLLNRDEKKKKSENLTEIVIKLSLIFRDGYDKILLVEQKKNRKEQRKGVGVFMLRHYFFLHKNTVQPQPYGI